MKLPQPAVALLALSLLRTARAVGHFRRSSGLAQSGAASELLAAERSGEAHANPDGADRPGGTSARPLEAALQQARQKECMGRYVAAMQALMREPGTDLVFGANDGHRWDPAWEMLRYWKKARSHRKILVEPSPPAFKRLAANFAKVEKAVLVKRAVVGSLNSSAPQSLTFHYWDEALLEGAAEGGAALPEEVRPPQSFWSAFSDVRREYLLLSTHVLDTDKFRGLTAEQQQSVRLEVERHILRESVPAATPEAILQDFAPNWQDVKYVQVDVETITAEIVMALPLGRRGFLPEVVLYEGTDPQGPEARFLASSGNYSFCVMYHSGGNVLAVLQH